MLQTIDGLLRKVASEHADAPALAYGDRRLNYRDLLREIDRTVAALQGQDIGRRIVFAVLSQNCLEVMVAYYAAARLGAVFVPINPSLTAREVAHIIAHSGAIRLFHDEAMREVAEQAAPASLRRPLHALSADVAPSIADAITDPTEDFLIIYTSGSTGTPKAVLFDQQAEIAGNASLIEMWGITERDITLVALPLGFLYGLSTAAATGLQVGGQVVIQPRFHPGEVLQAMVQHRVTIYHGVPTMFTMMLDYAEQNDLHIDLSFMRLLICAGAPLSAELKARFQARFGKAIDDYYALTEVRPVFGRFADDKNPMPPAAIGRASPGAVIRIVDGAGMEVADGVHGELVVRAPSTLKRYYKDEGLTKAAFLGDLFRTGDLGFRDAQGFYHLTGRIKDIIIRGGANIAPAEVEGVIGRHAGVQSAAVIGVPDRKYGEVPVAFVIRRSGAEVTPEALAELCRKELAEFKVPAMFRFVPDLPLGVTGKVDKNALKARWMEAQR
jgi:long-chain acyl-CoA synthetase